MRPGASSAANARAPVDAAVVARVGVERAIVQLDDHVESGAGEGADDLFAGEVQRRRLGIGGRIERGRPGQGRGRAPRDGRAVISAGRQPIELRIADQRCLLGRDDLRLEVALHPIAVDEGDAVVRTRTPSAGPAGRSRSYLPATPWKKLTRCAQRRSRAAAQGSALR